MRLTAAQKKTLKALAETHKAAELKALFAAIRAHKDETLLAAVKAKAKAKGKTKPPSLSREVELTLKPILGPAAEKADMLLEFVETERGLKLDFTPRGLADCVRRLQAHLTDAEIRAAAKALMAEVAERYSPRESVV